MENLDVLESGELLRRIKANRDKLDNCKKHFFPIGQPPYKLGMKLTCSNCGGIIDAVQAFRYAQGYKAAGGNPNDVVENYE